MVHGYPHERSKLKVCLEGVRSLPNSGGMVPLPPPVPMSLREGKKHLILSIM